MPTEGTSAVILLNSSSFLFLLLGLISRNHLHVNQRKRLKGTQLVVSIIIWCRVGKGRCEIWVREESMKGNGHKICWEKTPSALGHSMPDPAGVGSGLNLFPWAPCTSKHNPLGQSADIPLPSYVYFTFQIVL